MDPDTLALLEEKIQRAVETVAKLRKERDDAVAAAQATSGDAKRELGEANKAIETLRAECESLKAEREAVKQRLQKLLGHIDKLNAAV